MRLKIVNAGESVLRKHARPVTAEELASEGIQQLIEHLRDTMNDAPGVGLAAPQVGVPLQLAVIEDRQEYFASMTAEQISERSRIPVPFHVIVNPILHLQSKPQLAFFEGCLSVPGFTAVVPRSDKVRVECLDERGIPRIIEARGWYARILQHEIDHLQGVLYLDRMNTRSICTLANYDRFWKAKSKDEVDALLRKASSPAD